MQAFDGKAIETYLDRQTNKVNEPMQKVTRLNI